MGVYDNYNTKRQTATSTKTAKIPKETWGKTRHHRSTRHKNRQQWLLQHLPTRQRGEGDWWEEGALEGGGVTPCGRGRPGGLLSPQLHKHYGHLDGKRYGEVKTVAYTVDIW